MKIRWISVLLMAVLLLLPLLSGCGGSGEDAAPEDSPVETGEDAASEESPAQAGEESEIRQKMPHSPIATEPEEEKTLTISEAVNFLLSLPPETLGLDGNTMSDYQVYPATEVVFVDGLSCSKLFVYRTDDEAGTNKIQGVYLLSRGGQRSLFSLDQSDGTVTELPLPAMAITQAAESPVPLSQAPALSV